MKINKMKERLIALSKMKRVFLQSTVIVNLMFAIPFVIQMMSIWNSSAHPDYPSVRTSKKNLKDIEFPVSFKLCARDLQNKKRYSNYGYSSEYKFFEGKSSNASIRGWNGFSETNSSIGSVEGILLN